MIAAMAEWEREEIASRVAASVPIRAKMGKSLGGQASFGYAWTGGKLVPDPKEAPVRRLLYELFNEHGRKKTVARLLNERGHRTRSGALFSDTTVDRLIRDPAAKGIRRANYTLSKDSKKAWELKPESDWVLLEVEAIVPVELWEECNAMLDASKGKGKKKTRSAVHLFSGLAECYCSRKMYVPSNTSKYVCYGCRNKIPTDDLEAIFQEELRAFFFSPEEIAAHLLATDQTIREKDELLATLESERKKLTHEIDRLYDLYQSGEIDKEGFGRKYRPLSEREKQLADAIPEAQAELDVLKIGHLSQAEIVSEARDLYTRWPQLPYEERRRIVEAITERIVVGKGEVEISLFYAPPVPSRGGSGGSTPPEGGGSPLSPQDYGNKSTQLHGFIAAIS